MCMPYCVAGAAVSSVVSPRSSRGRAIEGRVRPYPHWGRRILSVCIRGTRRTPRTAFSWPCYSAGPCCVRTRTSFWDCRRYPDHAALGRAPGASSLASKSVCLVEPFDYFLFGVVYSILSALMRTSRGESLVGEPRQGIGERPPVLARFVWCGAAHRNGKRAASQDKSYPPVLRPFFSDARPWTRFPRCLTGNQVLFCYYGLLGSQGFEP